MRDLHAIGIARLTGFEKAWLKLTISHTVGYALSPLGEQFVSATLDGE